MAYNPQTWHDLPALDTPITAARLGVMEAGISAAYDQLNTVASAGTSLSLVGPATATIHDLTLTSASCAITLPSGFSGPTSILLILRQDITGGRAVTFSSITWLGDGAQPALATTAGAATILTFFTVNGGSTWFGSGTVEQVPVAHHASHEPGGSDHLDLTTVTRRGLLASRPAAASNLNGVTYFATDDRGGTNYRCNGTIWEQQGAAQKSALLPSSFTYTTFSRSGSTAASIQVLTSGQILCVGIDLPIGAVVNSISFVSGATALASGSNQWFGLFDQNSNKLAVTSDDTNTAWGTNAVKTLTLTAPYTTTYSGLHYIGIMVNAVTPPFLIATSSTGTIQTVMSPAILGLADTGLTNPASCPSTLAAFASAGKAPFAGIA